MRVGSDPQDASQPQQLRRACSAACPPSGSRALACLRPPGASRCLTTACCPPTIWVHMGADDMGASLKQRGWLGRGGRPASTRPSRSSCLLGACGGLGGLTAQQLFIGCLWWLPSLLAHTAPATHSAPLGWEDGVLDDCVRQCVCISRFLCAWGLRASALTRVLSALWGKG